MRHVIFRHRYSILVAFPIVAVVITSLGLSQSRDVLTLVPNERFLEIGATTSVAVIVHAQQPINAVGGSLVLPPELTARSISTDNSIVDLWTEEPRLSDTSQLDFSGGTIQPGGFVGKGELFTITVEATEVGRAELLLTDPQILAHDGMGTSLTNDSVPLEIVVRQAGTPSPDLTDTNRISIRDISLLTTRLFAPYDRRYDLNNDGRVTVADILILLRFWSL